jgi:peptidoglycan-associated lipoprotein
MQAYLLKSLFAAGLIAILTACSSVPLDDKAEKENGADDKMSAEASPDKIMDPFDSKSILAQQRSVYFAFDSYTVPDQYRTIVTTHANYLAAHTQQHVRIEGHTDPRGGAEYNLALGQRRAEAVAEIFALNGAIASQTETISLGKERATGTDEASWAQERRADIVYRR